MRSYEDLIIGSATNSNVAYRGALSPNTDDDSMEHFRTKSKQLDTKPKASMYNTYVSHGGGYPMWTHIQMVQFKYFFLFYFYGFNIIFGDKPSAVSLLNHQLM